MFKFYRENVCAIDQLFVYTAIYRIILTIAVSVHLSAAAI